MALIMVAEDSPDILALLRDWLKLKGHQVVTVEDGLQLAEKAQDWVPQLIIADIMMPNVYGTSAYQVLQDNPRTKGVPVIFVTGVDPAAAERVVPKAPNVRLMFKPVDMKKLEEAIVELLKPA